MSKLRLLYVGLTPIQNPRPFQLMQLEPSIDLTVLYLKPDPGEFKGEEYVNKDVFDGTDKGGYHHKVAKPLWPRLSRGLLTGLSLDPWRLAKRNDVVVVYGHYLASFWLAMLAARLFGRRLVLASDATYMEGSANARGWKLKLKPVFFRWLYNHLADAVFVPSTASRQFQESLGVKPGQIVVTPYVVNEPEIQSISARTDVDETRRRLGIPVDHTVFVFCAKFLKRKRPADAIDAFAKIAGGKSHLLMIGGGPLEGELHERVRRLNLQDKITFTGFVSYHALPEYYTASDVLVFCSDHEPYGLPVNEMMLCGRPVIVTDRIGARIDLVDEGQTGWVYPAGDVERLAAIMRHIDEHPEQLRQMGANAADKMKGWTSEINVSRQIELFEKRGWQSAD